MQLCPCGSEKNYPECCGSFIEGQQKPPTPEALMRSRYTAYTQANMDYLAQTMKAPASNRFNPKSASVWAKQVKWLRLEIKMTDAQGTKGFVEFIAYFEEQGKIKTLHEKSEFHYENNTWYYVDGEHLPLNDNSSHNLRVGRNDSCPCGSGKKYKKCCLLYK